MSILFLSFGLNAQRGTFEFNTGVSTHTYSMNRLNEFILSEMPISEPDLLFTPPKGSLSCGKGVFADFTYRAFEYLDLGVFGNFQKGRSTQQGQLIFIAQDLPIYNDTLTVEYDYRVPSFSIGLVSKIKLDNLLGWDKKENALGRVKLGVNVNIGLGYSRLHRAEKYIFTDQSVSSFTDNYQYTSQDFSGSISLDFGYRLSKQNIFSSIGINLGYQFFKTSNQADRSGTEVFNTSQKVHLDYSGIYLGVYLGIGK